MLRGSKLPSCIRFGRLELRARRGTRTWRVSGVRSCPLSLRTLGGLDQDRKRPPASAADPAERRQQDQSSQHREDASHGHSAFIASESREESSPRTFASRVNVSRERNETARAGASSLSREGPLSLASIDLEVWPAWSVTLRRPRSRRSFLRIPARPSLA